MRGMLRWMGMWSLVAAYGSAHAVSTPLSYQGYLEDGGQPANGLYDFAFQLRSSGGTNLGAAIALDDVPVSGGVFTVVLDFGLAAFPGGDRRLGIAVRPGASAGLYTPLAPDAPLLAAPYAQYANQAASAISADDVINGSIDESDIATSAVSARTIALGAVGSAEIADGTVTVNDIASGTLNLSRFQGANNNYTLTATIAANDCTDFDVTFGGDVNAGDVPILTIQPGFQLPDSMSITALRVLADNLVEIRICNELGATQSFSNLGVRLTTLR